MFPNRVGRSYSCVISVARPHPREQLEKMSQENRKIGRRPKWSASLAKPIAQPKEL